MVGTGTGSPGCLHLPPGGLLHLPVPLLRAGGAGGQGPHPARGLPGGAVLPQVLAGLAPNQSSDLDCYSPPLHQAIPYHLRTDFSKLLDSEVWVDAATQVTFLKKSNS